MEKNNAAHTKDALEKEVQRRTSSVTFEQIWEGYVNRDARRKKKKRNIRQAAFAAAALLFALQTVVAFKPAMAFIAQFIEPKVEIKQVVKETERNMRIVWKEGDEEIGISSKTEAEQLLGVPVPWSDMMDAMPEIKRFMKVVKKQGQPLGYKYALGTNGRIIDIEARYLIDSPPMFFLHTMGGEAAVKDVTVNGAEAKLVEFHDFPVFHYIYFQLEDWNILLSVIQDIDAPPVTEEEMIALAESVRFESAAPQPGKN